MKLFNVIIIKLVVVNSALGFYHDAIGIPEAQRIRKAEMTGFPPSRIAGGYYAYLGAYPFFGGLIVLLDFNTTSVCGASLLSNTKLVTAAHCWNDGEQQALVMEVVLGSTKLFSGGTRIITNDVFTHEEFNITTVQNDIAIITIPWIHFNNYIQPVTLPLGKSNFVNVSCQIIGFGRTGDETEISINQQLVLTHVTVISNEECFKVYGPLISESLICTSGSAGRGPCSGDSGGPLFYTNGYENILIGVVSFGSGFGCGIGHPSCHTRITSFVEWIQGRL